jgi:hypothetical protein
MNLQPHPSFGKSFQRFFLRAWLTAVALFAGAMLLLKNDFGILGAMLAAAFGIAVVGTLAYLFYGLYHVTCPVCGQQTRTTKDSTGTCWVAHCEICDTTWDLGVGVGTSD